MKLKRILAGVAATAMAVSTMVVASADAVEVCYNTPFQATVKADGKAKITLTGILQGEQDNNPNAGWNDWCCVKIAITDAAGNKTYDCVVGGSVTWDVTVDDNGTPDDDTDDTKFTTAEFENVMWGDCSEDCVLEYDVTAGSTVEVIALGWDSNPDEPYFKVDMTGVDFDMGISANDPSTDAPSTDETPSTDGDTAPKDDNTSTGLAGIALAGLAVSGAAVVATKKRK